MVTNSPLEVEISFSHTHTQSQQLPSSDNFVVIANSHTITHPQIQIQSPHPLAPQLQESLLAQQLQFVPNTTVILSPQTPESSVPTSPSSPYEFNTLSSPLSGPVNEDNMLVSSNATSPIPWPQSSMHDMQFNINNNATTKQVMPDGVVIAVQPKPFQVVNYNIWPSPEIEFSKQYAEPITIQASLMYNGTVEISEGFTNGDVQVLKPSQTRVAFPALHLNRMTPIKNTVQQSGTSPGGNFTIKFKIGSTIFYSNEFKLVSAVNQIPGKDQSGQPMRPRKSKSQTPTSDKSMSDKLPPNSSTSQPSVQTGFVIQNSEPPIKAKSVTHGSGKRRAVDPVEDQTQDMFVHVKVRGDETHRGFITVNKNATLKLAREEIVKSNNYPKLFRFWHNQLQAFVQSHQEDQIQIVDCLDKTCLVIESYDAGLDNIDAELLSMWINKKDPKAEVLVPIPEIISRMFKVYKPNTTDTMELNIINGGVSHFLANISKNRANGANNSTSNSTGTAPNSSAGLGRVSLDDFKLFLKFYGPPKECLNRVLLVYREPFFHGFARHSDAAELLKGQPGAFLVRYSESQLKDGFFAFNVNKGSEAQDSIENYSLRYDSSIQSFIFRGKRYSSLREFIKDPEYIRILKRGLPKTTVETIKESKYKDENQFLKLTGQLSIIDASLV